MLSLYVGAPALFLATAGSWAAVRRASARRSLGAIGRAIAVPAAGIGFAVLSTGLILGPALRFLPGGTIFRYPEKLVLGAVLAIAITAAYGADRITFAAMRRGARGPGESIFTLLLKRRADALVVLAATGLAIALQGLGMLVGRESVLWWFRLDPGSSSARWLGQVIDDLRLSIGYGATAAGLFAIALILLPPLGRRARGCAIFASVAVSLYAGALVLGPAPLPWRLRANPSGPRDVFRSRPFFDDRLALAAREGGRVFRYDRPPDFALRTPTGTLADGFSWDRRTLGRSSASEFGVEIAYDRTTDLLNPAGQVEALEYFRGRSAREQARFWNLAGVRLVISYGRQAPAVESTAADRQAGHRPLRELRLRALGSSPPQDISSNREAFRPIVSRRGGGR
jgi:hypothetical protein